MAPGHEVCACLLAWEWWLGHQKWINAKSTMALIVLVLGLIFWAVIAQFKKGGKNG